jgi:hypothetical protein
VKESARPLLASRRPLAIEALHNGTPLVQSGIFALLVINSNTLILLIFFLLGMWHGWCFGELQPNDWERGTPSSLTLKQVHLLTYPPLKKGE